MATKGPTLEIIARRIAAHLKRFEADPEINQYKDAHRRDMDVHPYYEAGAFASSNRVFVQYVGYQGHSSLSKADALAYLAWLDAGNVGTHWEARKK